MDGQTDKQTDRQTPCHGIVRAMHTRRAVITAELKSGNVQYRNKMYDYCCFVLVDVDRSLHEAQHIHTVKLIYRTMIVGRRQVTVRFVFVN